MKPNSQDYLLMSKFKLFLMDDTQDSLPNGLNVIDVIADYLRAFHDHVKSELLKGFAGNYDQSKFRYCLTVPAMWSDRAKAATREAAIRAGLVLRSDHPERLMLISEPEAAALYCEKKSEQFNLSHGQRFMICDAGGGTVDLIVFEIDQKPGQKRTLKEVTNGHGGSCGSAFLDVNMREYIKRKFSHLGSINDTAMEHIMDTFVNIIKPEFDGYEDHFLDLPASMGLGDLTDESIGLENGSICLPAKELCDQVFEPVIVQVLQLIEGQLNQSFNLEAIFLVGGFGQSNYLFRRVEEVFANRVGMIGVPPRGELAVVRGAVYFGLSPQQITERVSRRTYGVETRMLFQPNADPEEYSVIGVDGKKYCRQRFSVYVHKGQSIKVDECVSKTFVISYPSDTDSDLYAFDGEGPPPRLTSHPSIQKVGHFPIRMPSLEGVKPGDKVNMTIRMYFGLTEIKIECIIKDKTIVFTSAFEASDGTSTANAGYIQDNYAQPTPTMDPYANPNASQASFGGAYPPNGGYGNSTPQQQHGYPPQQGYPQTSYGGYPPQNAATAPYPTEDNYYQQPYNDNQGYPPQQQQQGYYGAGGAGGAGGYQQGYSQGGYPYGQ
ncbi:unnamed protein product [Cunninghamella blakesleeana]